jgi:hypothetical protein|tara:strand:- start:870 stop:1067 length:198 start_codon:yes stop_codon:yes gene_type:complete
VPEFNQTERLIQALNENTRAQLLLMQVMPDFIQNMKSADSLARAGLSETKLYEEAKKMAQKIKRR